MSTPERWGEGPWLSSARWDGNWLQRYWRWLVKPRGKHRRRRYLELTVAAGCMIVFLVMPAWTWANGRPLRAVAIALGALVFALALMSRLATLDLWDLDAPRKTSLYRMRETSPPGSPLYRAATRAKYLQRTYWILCGVWGMVLLAVAAAGQ